MLVERHTINEKRIYMDACRKVIFGPVHAASMWASISLKRALSALRYSGHGLIYCLLVLTYSSQLSAALPSVILYQDAELTIYDDTRYESELHKQFISAVDLSVVHKADVKEEILEIKKSSRSGQDYYEYGPSVMEDFRTKLPKLFASDVVGTVTMSHFLADHHLPIKVGSLLKTSRGQAIVQVIFMNKLNSERVYRQGSIRSLGQPYPPPGWTFYAEGTSDLGLISMRFLNTFAAAELGHYPGDEPSPSEKTEALAADTGLKSESAAEFGYEKARLILKSGSTEYFLVDSEPNKAIVKLVAVHAVGEEDWLVDLDIFPIRVDLLNDLSNEELGFLYSTAEISAFNQQVAPTVSKLINKKWPVEIYHYLKGKPLSEKSTDWNAVNTDGDPIFISRFLPLENSDKWVPYYPSRFRNPHATGNFDWEQTRYSYASARKYIKERSRNRMPGAKPAARGWMEEADEAYRYATPEARARREKYKLWTQSYWQFFNYAVGRNLIDGSFENIPLDDYFTGFYRTYLQRYSAKCSKFIKNATPYRFTNKIVHRYGSSSWEETIVDETTYVEQRFTKKYVDYYYNRSPEETKEPYGFEQHLSGMGAAARFVKGEDCDSPLQMRLQENLYRRSQGMPALTDSSEGKKVANNSVSVSTGLPASKPQPPPSAVIDNTPPLANASGAKPSLSVETDSSSSQLIAAASAPSFPSEMVIDNSVIDFILAKTLGNSLKDDLLRGMLISRWHYEHAMAAPPGGRFFDQSAAAVHEHDVVALLPAFRQWMIERGRKLPETMSISINVYTDKFSDTVQAVPVNGCFAVEDPAKLATYRVQFTSRAAGPDAKRVESCNTQMQARMQDVVACVMKNPANKQQCSEQVKNQHAQCLAAHGTESKSAWIAPVIQWASSELNERDCGGHASFSATRQVRATALGAESVAATPSRVAVKIVFDKGIAMPAVNLAAPRSLRLQIRPNIANISAIDRSQNSKSNVLAVVNASVVSASYQP